jgi:hypothetical protein
MRLKPFEGGSSQDSMVITFYVDYLKGYFFLRELFLSPKVTRNFTCPREHAVE